MPYDFMGSDYLDDEFDEEEADPRSQISNLADIMLVFSCGLLVALMLRWNLSSSTEIDTSTLTEVTDSEEMSEQTVSADEGYTELGTAYQDPTTGKVYIIEK